jgi:hypothetical protein
LSDKDRQLCILLAALQGVTDIVLDTSWDRFDVDDDTHKLTNDIFYNNLAAIKKIIAMLHSRLNKNNDLGALATAEYTESYACGEDTALSNLVEAGNSAQTEVVIK